jgi:immunity protein 5 of polymorphic toxin system
LDSQDHGWLAIWAADCAEHVLPRFEEERPTDARPRRAVEAGRAWARGEITMSQARAAAFDAHAAAREADRAEAQAAARAAATAHVATHAPHAAAYAVKAAAQTAGATSPSSAATEEREWQYRCLPEHLRPMAFPT